MIFDSAPETLDGGAGNDVLKFQGGYDISTAVPTGVEQLNAYGDGRLTKAQLASFGTVSRYDKNYTNDSIVLTKRGTAAINLSATLTDAFPFTVSTQAEILTFGTGYVGRVIIYVRGRQ